MGLHRGGLPEPDALAPLLTTIGEDAAQLSFAGFMGYEPHLKGRAESLEDPAVRDVLGRYRSFLDRARQADADLAGATFNGAGSHTLGLYEKDETMNDLAAGSAGVKPSDFDSFHLTDHRPALFIAAPVLKRYDRYAVPGDPERAAFQSWWDPNLRRIYYIYGGYWKANVVSVPLYRSTNQQPFVASAATGLDVDDYLFFRPTQSEHVMLQFGDLLTVKDGEIADRWPVFHQTG